MVRVRFWVTVLGLLSAAALYSATTPPRDLRLVGDHWTAYYPPDPASFPPGSNVHIIERGDTLWDLAERFYGDPYLWPQLWENNTYITDSHWIYPGDPLLIQGEVTTGEIAVQTDLGMEEGFEESAITTSLTAAMAPRALGVEADIYCWGYLGHPDEPLPNRIVSFEDYETKFVVYADTQDSGVVNPDIIYLELGDTSWVFPGETYMVLTPMQLIKHPETGGVVGRHYDYRGRVRILCVQGAMATAIVVQACEPIRIGDAIKPMPQDPIPLVRMTAMAEVCDPPNAKPKGFIVNAKDYHEALGEGNVVEMNLGRDQLIEPGSFLTVYRESPIEGNPRVILGEIGVLTADGSTSTGQIIRMRYSMRVGDRVELK